MEHDRKKSKDKDIEDVRRTEERRGRRYSDPEAVRLQRRLERNARELLELDLDEFLSALKEDYKLNESQLAKAKAFWLQSRGG